MNRINLIHISEVIRDKKDHLRAEMKNKARLTLSSNSLIFPQQTFRNSYEIRSQQWYYNGFAIKINGLLIVVDPGVDFYTRFLNTNLSIHDIRAIIVSHAHIDHSASLSLFIDKILKFNNNLVQIFIAEEVFETVISGFYKDKLKNNNIKVVILNDQKKLDEIKILGTFNIQFVL